MSLNEIITNTRETAILNNYNAAIIQIQEMVETNPFQSTFTITSGCTSVEMTNEISTRFNKSPGVKAIVQQSGMMKNGWSILLTYPLPE